MGGKKKDKDKDEDGKDKSKDQEKESGKEKKSANGKKNASAANKKAGGNVSTSGGYILPEPDRTYHVSAPAVFPPASTADEDGAEEEELYFETVPRKLQLSHLSLLTHPVFIGAIDNFMMEDECRTWVEWGEKRGFEEAKQKQTAEMAHRDNGRIEIDSPEVANLIWLRMKNFVPEVLKTGNGNSRQAVGCSPRIRLYRYVRGQRFAQHVDGSRDEPSLGGRTHFTVLVYLNGGERDSAENRVRGGETVFWKDRNGNPTTQVLAFPPTRGICLFHGHGDECMIHEGAPVEQGIKYVLRTDVCYELEK